MAAIKPDKVQKTPNTNAKELATVASAGPVDPQTAPKAANS